MEVFCVLFSTNVLVYIHSALSQKRTVVPNRTTDLAGCVTYAMPLRIVRKNVPLYVWEKILPSEKMHLIPVTYTTFVVSTHGWYPPYIKRKWPSKVTNLCHIIYRYRKAPSITSPRTVKRVPVHQPTQWTNQCDRWRALGKKNVMLLVLKKNRFLRQITFYPSSFAQRRL